MSDQSGGGRRVDGLKMAIELLNSLDATSREKLLANMMQQDPAMAQKLKNNLFTFEDIIKFGERTMQSLIKRISTKTLALALRNASEQLKSHFYKNMSQRAAQLLKEDSENMGPQKLSEVRAAQQDIIDLAKQSVE